MRHIPVLLDEVVEALALKPGDRVIDATVGDGGHSEAFVQQISPQGQLLALDADPESLLRAERFLYAHHDLITFVRTNFLNIEQVATDHGFTSVSGILMDLGWSLPQFKERGRGFSFELDEPLDMRYTPTAPVSAQNLLATMTIGELESVFKMYGEEPFSRAIAEKIVEQRAATPYTSTQQLVATILGVYREKLHSTKEIPWTRGLHPATRIFQALRIAVNHELEVLKGVLPQAVRLLRPGGRLAIITFHSLEDRIVKHFFLKEHRVSGEIITKKPVCARPEEISRNSASRSAKLRIFQKK